MSERERQMLQVGCVVTLESLLEENYINIDDIPKIKEVLEKHRAKITMPDIILGLEQSKLADEFFRMGRNLK